MTLSKGSKPRPIKDRKKFDANWDNIFRKDNISSKPAEFWNHDCPSDGPLSIQKGYPCNWCGIDEDGNYTG